MFGKKLAFVLTALFLLLFSAAAFAANSSIEVNVKEAEITVKPEQHFIVKLNLDRLVDDDNDIEAVDIYLLDVREKFDVVTVQGQNWQHEFIERFNDEHAWIRNAKNQSVKFHLKPKKDVIGTYYLKGYFEFMDADGGMIGLGDNETIGPWHNSQTHQFVKITVQEKKAGMKAGGNDYAVNPKEGRTAALFKASKRVNAQDPFAFLKELPFYVSLNSFLAGIFG